MGLRKVDVNFDSLNFMKYQKITGKDSLYRVLDGVEKVEKLNYPDIRLNVFLFQGINEDELIDFARMTKDRKLHIRFLEYHPQFPETDPYSDRLKLSVLDAKRLINDYQQLVQVHDLDAEVAVPTFKFLDGAGKISFLSKIEIEAEKMIPRVVFSAEGVLFNELVQNRPQAILADLRRDAKEDRLHRTIEKVLMLHSLPVKPKKKEAALRTSETKTQKRKKTKSIGRSAPRTTGRRSSSRRAVSARH